MLMSVTSDTVEKSNTFGPKSPEQIYGNQKNHINAGAASQKKSHKLDTIKNLETASWQDDF